MIELSELQNVDRISRIDIAHKVGHIIQREQSNNTEDSAESQSALEVAKLLAQDASIAVREALSHELRECQYLPASLIEMIVNDIDQVAMPFLVVSEALDDELLEQLVNSCGEAVKEAIAQRNGLSEMVSFAISDLGGRDAVENLVENDTADVSLRTAQRVVDRFPEDSLLLNQLSKRADLPMEIVETLIFKLSRQYSEYLMHKFHLAEDYSSYLSTLANKSVFLQSLDIAPVAEVQNYLEQLHSVRQLTGDKILGYIQKGHLRLFTSSISILANRHYDTVEKSLAKGGRKVLNKLLHEANIPDNICGVLTLAFERHIRG